MVTAVAATMTIAASATTATEAPARASTGIAPGLASSAKAGVSGDSSGGDSSVGDCSVGDCRVGGGDGNGNIGDSCVCACSVGGGNGNGRIGDGSDDDTGGNCGDCGGSNVSKAFWSPRRKSNACVAFADSAVEPRPNRSVSTDARAINIAQ